jgi:hypothetical protein
MAVDFTRTDLLTDISDRELTALTAKLIHAGDADPVSAAIARAQMTVERYTARYTLDSDTEKGFIRDLTLYYLYSRVTDAPPNRLTAYEQSLREMRDIRDGKYPNLPLNNVQDMEGGWGSVPRIGGN